MIRKVGAVGLVLVVALASCASGAGRESAEAATVVPPIEGPAITQQEMAAPTLLEEAHYASYVSMRREGPVVPGIFQGAVPQGMAYDPQRDLLLISNYMDDGRQSCIVSVSLGDGILRRVFWLEEPDGTPHTGHVGGLAVSSRTLWVASGNGVFHAGLDALDGGDVLRMDGFIRTEAKGSFATFADGTLWVGEFTRSDGSYAVPRSHNVRTQSGLLHYGWMAGYTLDPVTDLIPADRVQDGVAYPDRIISIPHEVQGAAFVGDSLVLSHSYGRQNKSRISIYESPLISSATGEFEPPVGPAIPIWVADEELLFSRITAPPMSEGVVAMGDEVLVLFESGSDKYRETALDPLDRVQVLDLISR